MIDVTALIRRRSVGLEVPTGESEGYYDFENGGVWVPPQVTYETVDAVVVPVQVDEVMFDNGGAYVNQYRKAYTSSDIEIGTKVKFKGRSFTVMEAKDYSDYAAGLRVYFIKRTDADD